MCLTCRCWGWTSCPAADRTAGFPGTGTGRCRGSEAGSLDTRPRTHIRTARRPTAGQQGTPSPHFDLHTDIHLNESRKTEVGKVHFRKSNRTLLDMARTVRIMLLLETHSHESKTSICLFILCSSCSIMFDWQPCNVFTVKRYVLESRHVWHSPLIYLIFFPSWHQK